jgi:hypothetical protein
LVLEILLNAEIENEDLCRPIDRPLELLPFSTISALEETVFAVRQQTRGSKLLLFALGPRDESIHGLASAGADLVIHVLLVERKENLAVFLLAESIENYAQEIACD